MHNELELNGYNIATVIHPFTSLAKDVNIGKGCTLNTSCTVDHDSIIGDFVHLSPGVSLAGEVQVGNSTWLGINSTIINKISITGNCILGAGSVVIRDITEEGIYGGNIAKRIGNISKK
ncbi:hypothetical protein ACNNMY_08365 [Aerococcus urinaeequi]|uniref:hypothetical protein n=1 Tax=Aerococcus urinaeequi TaxID=51665 RepID=UPI003AAAF86C